MQVIRRFCFDKVLIWLWKIQNSIISNLLTQNFIWLKAQSSQNPSWLRFRPQAQHNYHLVVKLTSKKSSTFDEKSSHNASLLIIVIPIFNATYHTHTLFPGEKTVLFHQTKYCVIRSKQYNEQRFICFKRFSSKDAVQTGTEGCFLECNKMNYISGDAHNKKNITLYNSGCVCMYTNGKNGGKV